MNEALIAALDSRESLIVKMLQGTELTRDEITDLADCNSQIEKHNGQEAAKAQIASIRYRLTLAR